MTKGITTRNLLFAGAISFAFLMSGACAESGKDEQPDEVQPAAAQRTEPMSREERLAMRQKLQKSREIEKVAETDVPADTPVVSGEVPDELLATVYADLEKRSAADRSGFELVGAEAVRWPDGSLGCPEPGQMYTQALVNGYRIVIRFDDQEYDYRVADGDYFKLCPGPGLTR